ncbi:MAG: GAF domain-containing protein [Gammaproteobacteria bacterium]|nr:MAG: GAF domain-containing protein [Gammaproteobacteria bacterium]
MPAPPRPLNEEERLAVLERYRILDTEGEVAYDDAVALAAAIVNVPVALLSLVDRDRQWFKARVGLDVEETPRTVSFCAWAVYEDANLVVADATEDERFADNELVWGELGVRFYAGVPLRTPDNLVLGTLCVIDHQRREITPEQLAHLERLASLIMHLLENRRAADELAEALERAGVLGEMIPVCAYCRRIRDDEQFWHTLEKYLESHAGTQVSHGICPACASRHFADL